MPADLQKKFQENLEHWKQLPAAQQVELRCKAEQQLFRMGKEIDDALAKSGLKLDAGQKTRFYGQFIDERRVIEDRLHKEMDEKRRAAMDDLMKRLVDRFKNPTLPAALAASPTVPSATPSAPPSATPKPVQTPNPFATTDLLPPPAPKQSATP